MIDLVDVSVAIDEIILLAPVSVSVPAGQTLVVRGRNGSGKSTLLRVLTGIHAPTSGTARIADAEIAERSPQFRRRVAAMIGLPPMAPDLTVRDHVLLVASTWNPETAQRVADSVLDELGLTRLAARFPHELSSGQTQLFGLSLVLARPCDVLILDEPEQRLDPEHVQVVIDVLRRRHHAGATMIIATHSPVIADELGDATLRLDAAA